MKNPALLEKYNFYRNTLDIDRLLAETRLLHECEKPQTTSAYHASADKCVELLKASGIPNVEKITFPADGKTSWQDKISPLGWEASSGRLTIKKAANMPENFVVADYQRHPFELIKGSVGTAPGGEEVRLVNHNDMLAGADVTGALVIAPMIKSPNYNYISRCLDLGVRGFVSDYTMNSASRPDGIQWCNAFTEHNNWHVNCGDRPFIAFSVSPATGRLLRQAADLGSVICHMESDARRVESTIDAVTALIPGKSSREFWLLAHLYEPLANDNSSGVAAVMEIARQIMKQGTPDYSLRLVFAMEFYGFAAYAVHRGDRCLADEVIGACNCDAMYLRPDWKLKLCHAGPATPSFCNMFLRELCDTIKGEAEIPELIPLNSFNVMYEDDSFLSDNTTGVATMWPIRLQDGSALWHNSAQEMDYIDRDAFAVGCAINLTLTDCCINPDRKFTADFAAIVRELMYEEKARLTGAEREHLERRKEIIAGDIATLDERFEADKKAALAELESCFETLSAGLSNEIPGSPWRDYASQIVPSRTHTGLPFNLAKLPPAQRRTLPGNVIYGPLAAVLANMDGKRTLAEILRRTEHEICEILSESQIKSLMTAIFFLARHGYLSLNGFTGITKADIVSALRSAGVKPGDFLLVHSSLSSFGCIEGNGETVIEALREAVGEEGTFLLPSFNFSFVNIGGPNRNLQHRPYDKNNLDSIWTGQLPKTLLAKYPQAVRSAHITHSWCGLGAQAAAACAAHKFNDPPAGASSPLAYAEKAGGKIIHFGNSIGSTTYLHHVETLLGLPGLADTLCMVKGADGIAYPVAVPDNLPGCREFYSGEADEIKFFRRAQQEKNLQIVRRPLGLGTIILMEIPKLHKAAVELAAEDPFILLHDEGSCSSCDKLRKLYIQQNKQ